MNILEVKDLKKAFKKNQAVAGVSFEIRKGICFGLLGPNGAGKSTTMELIEGVKKPDSGEIFFFGEPRRPEHLDQMGVQFQLTSLPPKLTTKETLHYFMSLYHSDYSFDEIVKKCTLTSFLDRQHEKLSGGQRQRLMLAIAICHRPSFVLLDEPTTGLDPQSRRNLWDLIEEIKEQEVSVLLTTHYMDEAEILCDELAIMDEGKVIARGTPDILLNQNFKEVIVSFPFNENLKEELKKLGFDVTVKIKQEKMQLTTPSLDQALKKMLEVGIDLSEMNVRKYNLEDLFIKLTGKELRA